MDKCNLTMWEPKWDARVLEAIRSGTATIPSLRRDLGVPPGALKKVLSRLTQDGKIRKVARSWYTSCE
jgi:DNA-binding HxlR family transcriptional regulator